MILGKRWRTRRRNAERNAGVTRNVTRNVTRDVTRPRIPRYTPGMAKRAVNIRIDAATIERFDAWCAAQGSTRTASIETFMRTVTTPAASVRPPAAPVPRQAPATTREELQRNALTSPRQVQPIIKGKP